MTDGSIHHRAAAPPAVATLPQSDKTDDAEPRPEPARTGGIRRKQGEDLGVQPPADAYATFRLLPRSTASLAAARARKWANPQLRREPRTARPGQRTDSARPKHTPASSASACAPSTITIRSISVTADWAEIVCSSSGPPRGRRAALAPYSVPAPAARIRPAFRQRPRDAGDVPIRAGARVPGRSTPSRS